MNGEDLAKREILLNHLFLKNRIAELGLKQWWLAEQIGVDRKTVIRWIQGQVQALQTENAEKLAKILDCQLSDLTAANIAEQLATSEDQKTAASLLMTSSLIDKLGPIGEWNVIESLLKATIIPNLPLNILGELFDKMTIASWRQSKIDQASIYNMKSIEIAQKISNQSLLASAFLSKGNIHSWKGQVSRSIEAYQECLALEKYVEPRKLGSILSNLGAVLYESGNLSEGEKHLNKAIKVFKEHGKPMNLSIAHGHLAIIYLQKGQIDQSSQEIQVSIDNAHPDEYLRGKQMGKLIQAEIAAHRGSKNEALLLVEDSLNQFSNLGIIEGLNFEYAGRIHRLLGSLDQSEKFLRQGISVSQEFPVYLAALYTELAEVLRLTESKTWNEMAKKAIEIYRASECPLRVEMVQKRFRIL